MRHILFLGFCLSVLTQGVFASGDKPNILVIWGDDVGVHNISTYNHGLMGYETPNIDRIAKEGAMFTHYYAHQSCTAGRSIICNRAAPVPHWPANYRYAGIGPWYSRLGANIRRSS